LVPGQQRGRNHRPFVVLSSGFSIYVRVIVFVPSAQKKKKKKRGGIFLLAESWIVVAPRFYATKKLQSVSASGFFLW
jgi:hypothetical protein